MTSEITPPAGRDDLRDRLRARLHAWLIEPDGGEDDEELADEATDAALEVVRPKLDRLREAADRERRATDTAHWHLNRVTKDRLKWEQEAVARQHRAERAERERDEARAAADPFKIERVKSIVTSMTRLVQIERDDARQRAEQAEAKAERLRRENELLRVRAAGADSRNDILTRRIARVRQMADTWESTLPDTIRTATAAQAIRDATEEST